MRFLLRTTCIGCLMLSAPLAKAAETDYGLVARKTLAAFVCSHVAALAKDQKELERLFLVGLEAGRTYVVAARAGRLTERNNASAPIGVLWHLEGPSVDFVVGRIYEVAAKEAREKVKPLGSDFVLPAQNAYTAMNCAVIK